MAGEARKKESLQAPQNGKHNAETIGQARSGKLFWPRRGQCLPAKSSSMGGRAGVGMNRRPAAPFSGGVLVEKALFPSPCDAGQTAAPLLRLPAMPAGLHGALDLLRQPSIKSAFYFFFLRAVSEPGKGDFRMRISKNKRSLNSGPRAAISHAVRISRSFCKDTESLDRDATAVGRRVSSLGHLAGTGECALIPRALDLGEGRFGVA